MEFSISENVCNVKSCTALEQARELANEQPTRRLKKGGEFEGGDFWEKHESLLTQAWSQVTRLHPELYVYDDAFQEKFINSDLRRAVQKLKELHNPHYVDVEIDDKFMEKGNKQKDELEMNATTQTDVEKSDDELADVDMLNSVKQFQADRDENTCLVREDLESIIVENKTNKTIHIKKGKESVISIAPGENKVGSYTRV